MRRSIASPQFERTLADDGAVILKFWMHLDRDAQKKRLSSCRRIRSPAGASRGTSGSTGSYTTGSSTAERLIQPSTGQRPWTIVDGSDERYRSLGCRNEIHP